MTKAFTSALGYGITVRGYIDEDDKLVLLEPEGGGGGGGLTAVHGTVTVSGEYALTPAKVLIAAVDTESGFVIPTNISLITSFEDPLDVVAGSFITVENSTGSNVTVTGDVEDMEAGVYLVTGDFTITCTYGA